MALIFKHLMGLTVLINRIIYLFGVWFVKVYGTVESVGLETLCKNENGLPEHNLTTENRLLSKTPNTVIL